MKIRLIMATALLSAPLLLAAEKPNIEPGEWEYENTMRYGGDVPIPDQTATSTDCVTIEDLEQGDAFLDDADECDVVRSDIRRDGMDYAMECDAGDGTKMTMEGSMQFMGDRSSGTLTGEMDTPMGHVTMTIDLEGRRIGDC